MIIIDDVDTEKICLLACTKKLINMNNKYYKLTIGKTIEKFIFIRLIFECSYYENFFDFENENNNDIYKLLIDSNDPSYSINEGSSAYLYFLLGNINESINFTLNINLDVKDIIITDNTKIEYNYNTKILSDEEIMNLSNISFNNEDFENLCHVKMHCTLLILDNNDISDISPLKSENIKFLQELNLSFNLISNIEVFNKLKLENLEELALEGNGISDIRPFENAEMNNLEKLYLNNNNINNIKALENVNFNNLTQLNLSNNKISDISVLENCEFYNLIDLNLSKNEIKKILIKKVFSFPNLKCLDISFK